jgi:hypothetical protein
MSTVSNVALRWYRDWTKGLSREDRNWNLGTRLLSHVDVVVPAEDTAYPTSCGDDMTELLK